MKQFGNNLHSGFFKKINTIISGVVLLGIIIVVNLIANQLPWSYDMTADKIFTLSSQTLKVIADLKKPLKIFAFFPEGDGDPSIKTLLGAYRRAGGGKIQLTYIDADKNPAAAKKFDRNNEGVANGTIIFDWNGKIRKINKLDLITPNDYGKTFTGEQQFTAAITYLTAAKFQKVYFIQGHQELNLENDLSQLKTRLMNEANTIQTINLIKSDADLKKADLIAVISPKRDLSGIEKTQLQDYLEKGGRGLFLFDIQSPDVELPNFSDLLTPYGISIRNNFVVEEDSDSFYSDSKMYLVPYYTEQPIVNQLKNNNLLTVLPYAGNIDTLSDIDRTVTVEPLLKSSKTSWIRYNVKDATPTKTDSDKSGPANLAVAVTKDNTELKYPETKIVVIYNAKFILDSMLDMQGNYDLFMNAFSWLQDQKDSIAIRPKMIGTNMMFLKGTQSIILIIIAVLVIPLVVFGVGLFVWLRRRHL
ncbi:MAG TPA: GldG family protein [Bacillota bacterium]|nr:GldG family protein [Bacillota bacterium]